MRNIFCLLLVLSTTFAADRAMAVDMDDLEVTIRVIPSGKEGAAEIGHKLELPDLRGQKVETHQQTKTQGHEDRKDGLSEEHQKDESRGQFEQHETSGSSIEHQGGAKEDHERAIEQYENNREEHNKALEQREDLKDTLDQGDREDARSGDSTGGTDN